MKALTSGFADEHVDEREIDRWIEELRRIVVGGQIEVVCQVGEFLIEKVYRSVEAAQSRRPVKAASLRRLSERAAEFGMQPRGLARAVPMALQVRQLGRPLAARIGIRHHRALLPVKDPAEKKLLAEAAADAGWTADQLRAKVRVVQKPHRGGRPPEPGIALFVRAVARATEAPDFARFRKESRAVPPAEAKTLLARINAAQAALERAEKLLTREALAPAPASRPRPAPRRGARRR